LIAKINTQVTEIKATYACILTNYLQQRQVHSPAHFNVVARVLKLLNFPRFPATTEKTPILGPELPMKNTFGNNLLNK